MTNPPLSLTETAPDRIRIVASFPGTSPEKIFEYWTRPELLKKWWPPEADLTLEKDGGYHFWWPKQNWHLRGKFTQVVQAKRLDFTWKWDHEMVDETNVILTLDPLAHNGTMLSLQHTGYVNDAEGRKIRDEHIEGWMYFLGQLQKFCDGPSASK